MTQHIGASQRGALRDASQDVSQSLGRRGMILLAVFGLVWAAAGISGIGNAAIEVPALGAALVVTMVVVVLALRIDATSATARPRRLPANWRGRLAVVNIAQVAAIALAVVILGAVGMPMLIPATVCLIVGVHFFPLARLFDQEQYWWTAVGLCLVAAGGFVTLGATDGEASRAVVGLGAAATLWGTALHVARYG